MPASWSSLLDKLQIPQYQPIVFQQFDHGGEDESPYIGKAGFKANKFAWDKFLQSPEQKAQMSPRAGLLSDERDKKARQELNEALLNELRHKEKAIHKPTSKP